ncbi:MAG: methyltransferase domain-containing protein [Dehalococcoidales bacterium]|nr:methyltransferase domain-containing protein [Dehalococcoidales bacterium]
MAKIKKSQKKPIVPLRFLLFENSDSSLRIWDKNDLIQVNELWSKVYPYLAAQAIEYYGRETGRVLELGPFSGGIAKELGRCYPDLEITVNEGFSLQHGKKKKYDLIILRGAFFFILDKKTLLRAIFESLKDGGTAFVGGGYGKDIPQGLIDEIADESRILNDRLGRRRVSIEELRDLVKQSGLKDNCRIEEEGGVWLVIRK